MFAAQNPPATKKDALARLGWQDFEHLLAEHYRGQGYRVEHAAPAPSLKALGSSLDLRLRRGTESLIVQCQHWDALEVPAQEVSELLSTMLNEAATGGVLVTRGRFSADAMALARRQPRLQLVDGDVLRVMLKLPDHLDANAPGVPRPSASTRKVVSRHGSRTHGSLLMPVVLGTIIVLLIAVFAWRMTTARTTPPPSPTPSSAEPAVTPSTAPPPQAPPAPPERVTTSQPHDGEPTRELREREHLLARQPAVPHHDAPQQSDDAMRVMEQNTREVGSSH